MVNRWLNHESTIDDGRWTSWELHLGLLPPLVCEITAHMSCPFRLESAFSHQTADESNGPTSQNQSSLKSILGRFHTEVSVFYDQCKHILSPAVLCSCPSFLQRIFKSHTHPQGACASLMMLTVTQNSEKLARGELCYNPQRCHPGRPIIAHAPWNFNRDSSLSWWRAGILDRGLEPPGTQQISMV